MCKLLRLSGQCSRLKPNGIKDFLKKHTKGETEVENETPIYYT